MIGLHYWTQYQVKLLIVNILYKEFAYLQSVHGLLAHTQIDYEYLWIHVRYRDCYREEAFYLLKTLAKNHMKLVQDKAQLEILYDTHLKVIELIFCECMFLQ